MNEHKAATLEDVEISIGQDAAVIGEIHHRIKNNLQLLISLIGLQAHRTAHEEAAELLRATQSRIRAMSILYDRSCSIEVFSIVHFGNYLSKLAQELQSFHGTADRVKLNVMASDMALDSSVAVPLALISNELLSNPLKHAFPDDSSGEITVRLEYAGPQSQHETAEMGELIIADNGGGFPDGFDIETAESMGFYLVRILTQQLSGELRIQPTTRGTSVRLLFPLTR